MSLATLPLAACAHRAPAALRASSLAAPLPLLGAFAGSVTRDGDVLTLQLDSTEVHFTGLGPGDVTPLEEVTVRAVVATDSAGHGIPLGASGALPIAEVLQAGERRRLAASALALPLPPGAALRNLWVAFQLRGTARPSGQEAQLIIAYACSEGNLLGRTRAAAARARRMRASYGAGCRL